VRSGGDLLVEAEVLFNRCDADFELLAFVDFVLLELGQLGVEAIEFRVELVDTTVEARLDCCEIVFGRHVFDDIGEYLANLFEGGFLRCHTPEVYHADPLGHECADSAGVTQHEKWKKSARILEARIMRIGCDVHHGFGERTNARGAGLGGGSGVGCKGSRGAGMARWKSVHMQA
jgi:hypothetical protein